MHVLILEDDTDLCSVWRDYIEDQGHSTHPVGTVHAAFDALHFNKFDLLLLDLLLTDGNSVGVSHYAKTIQPACRIIMITGTHQFMKGDHLQQAPGVDWLLHKPVKLDDLGALIDYIEHEPKTDVGLADLQVYGAS
ncbi:response regulator [Nereida sp. MMG025]|uniref:response regulator n=1 Tax=Nereida sp. MMG025 TaxID=2909981 RepID=UPI001EFF99BE|nr:response regulator [Nereida sp. MMG025]MCF6445337.1 response regulator [Nereida sp. MMG025]